MPEEKESKSNKHFYTSIVKSFLRIAGCGSAIAINDPSSAVIYLAALFLAAEILGIVEEL